MVGKGSYSLYLVNSSLNQFAQITSPEGSFDIYDLRELPHDPINISIYIYITNKSFFNKQKQSLHSSDAFMLLPASGKT